MEHTEAMPTKVRIASALKKAIYAGEIKSGEELSLTGIAAEMGVSRTPVREAFQELAADGLITLRMNRGAIVNEIDDKFIRDIFETRILLESEAAARAAAHGMDVASLLAKLYHLQDNLAVATKEDYEALNNEIHTSIWDAADNFKMKSFLMDLWNGPSTGSAQWKVREHYRLSTEEHIELCLAIRSQDSEKARQIMSKHIARSLDNLLAEFTNT